PGDFVPIAEQSGLIMDLDDWVMHEAIRQLAEWQREGIGLCMSMNVSARQFETAGFCERLRVQFAQHPNVDPSALKLEIVESIAINDLEHAAHTIEECAQLGVRFALDDFGTGYASIAYLRQLPVASIKIDHSFVAAMLDNPSEYALVKSLIGMAEFFRLECIAEGVESTEQMEALTAVGCYKVQGFAVAHPMPAEALYEWLKDWPVGGCLEQLGAA
ncbi:MAG: EAL domain-containing protein, partial [Gammaproteobacteria bacterium]